MRLNDPLRDKLPLHGLLLASCLFVPFASASEPDHVAEGSWEVALHYDAFRAANFVVQGFPTRLGRPFLNSRFIGADLGWRREGWRTEHRVRLAGHWPGNIQFDDGYGTPQVLNERSSRLFDLTASYGFDWYFLRRRRISLALGAAATGAYNRCQLDYVSIGKTRSWDWSTGLGVTNVVEAALTPKVQARLELENLFYLPWLSAGRISRLSATEAYQVAKLTSGIRVALRQRIQHGLELEGGLSLQEELMYAAAPGYAFAWGDVIPFRWQGRRRQSLFILLRKRSGGSHQP